MNGQNDGAAQSRPVWQALWRGALGRCPACGDGRLYRAYLKTVDACPACGEELHHHRADDAPPYVTIFVIGHVVVAAVLAVDLVYALPMAALVAVWFPVATLLCLGFLPVAKGALVALQWALRMHGFGGTAAQQSDAGGDRVHGIAEVERERSTGALA